MTRGVGAATDNSRRQQCSLCNPISITSAPVVRRHTHTARCWHGRAIRPPLPFTQQSAALDRIYSTTVCPHDVAVLSTTPYCCSLQRAWEWRKRRQNVPQPPTLNYKLLSCNDFWPPISMFPPWTIVIPVHLAKVRLDDDDDDDDGVFALFGAVRYVALSPVHTSNNVEATLSDCRMLQCRMLCCFDIVASVDRALLSPR